MSIFLSSATAAPYESQVTSGMGHQPALTIAQHRGVAAVVARIAVRSLYTELVLYPKPGLVSLRDNGSHTDMNAETFLRSLFSLRHYFRDMTLAGIAGADFQTLKELGIHAEQRMLIATKGINTHRGAIFCLGLLCAALGHCLEHRFSANQIRSALIAQWGTDLTTHSVVALHEAATVLSEHSLSHGLQVAQHYAISGAREEAALGFPSVFELALPHLLQSLKAGRSTTEAQIDALFLLMANMYDTNVYYRGGAEAAAFSRQSARHFLNAGGTAQTDWLNQAQACHQAFVIRRLSPGGAADLLAATWFIYQVENTVFSGCYA